MPLGRSSILARLLASLSFAVLLASPGLVRAQAVAPVIPENMVAKPGETKTNNVSSGSRSTLTISTSSSFGTTTSVNAMNGVTSESTTNFVPEKASFKSQFGNAEGKRVSGVLVQLKFRHNNKLSAPRAHRFGPTCQGIQLITVPSQRDGRVLSSGGTEAREHQRDGVANQRYAGNHRDDGVFGALIFYSTTLVCISKISVLIAKGYGVL